MDKASINFSACAQNYELNKSVLFTILRYRKIIPINNEAVNSQFKDTEK